MHRKKTCNLGWWPHFDCYTVTKWCVNANCGTESELYMHALISRCTLVTTFAYRTLELIIYLIRVPPGELATVHFSNSLFLTKNVLRQKVVMEHLGGELACFYFFGDLEWAKCITSYIFETQWRHMHLPSVLEETKNNMS